MTGPLLVRAIGRHPNILGVREQALLDVKEWYIAQGVPASKVGPVSRCWREEARNHGDGS